jgi:hypothetical protein
MNFGFLRLLLVVLSCCIAGSCTYTPDENFYKKIEEVNPENFTISLDSYGADTIFLTGPRKFEYSLGSGNGRIRETRVLLNNTLLPITTGTQTSGAFTVTPTTGVYELRIEFVSSSGTGSMAEQASAEMVEVWKKWIIKAYVETPPENPKITTSVINGYSVIEWPRYTKTMFVQYRVDLGDGRTPLTITDPDITRVVDSAYTGRDDRTYRVYVDNQVGTGSDAAFIKFHSVTVDATFNPTDSMVTVIVPKVVYYGAFKSYSILEDGAEAGLPADLDQSTYTFKAKTAGINSTASIFIQFNPKLPVSHPLLGLKTLDTSVPLKKFPRVIQKFSYSKELNSVIGFASSGTSTGKLFRIDQSTFALTDSIEIYDGPGFYVPYNGVYAYYAIPKKLTQVNLLTHAEKSIDAITSTFGSGPSSITASEPQIVSYGWFGPGAGNTIIYYTRLYDMATDQPITETQQTGSTITYTISDDAKFIRTADNQIYKLNGGVLTLTGILPPGVSWLGFRKDLCEEILTRSGVRIYVYDANSLELKRVMQVLPPSSTGTPQFHSYDVATKNLVFYNSAAHKLYTVNIDNGTTKEFNVNITTSFAFINGAIILNSKEYIKVY